MLVVGLLWVIRMKRGFDMKSPRPSSAQVDMRQPRSGAGIGGLEEITVTASDLAILEFCDMAVALSGSYPNETKHPDLTEPRTEGRRGRRNVPTK